MNREQIINNMCMTFRHDFGLEISEDDRMYTLMSGMTKSERESLWNSMAQVFDNDIAHLLEDYKRIKEGTHIPMPTNVDQARGMIILAEHYLKHNA